MTADNEVFPGVYREVDLDTGVVFYWIGQGDDTEVRAFKLSDERLQRVVDSGVY